MSLLNDFKTFILRGNVVDLAIAVVIGAAFKTVVDSLVADLVTPIIAMVGGEPDFTSMHFTINDAQFRYGAFLTAVLSFLIIAAVIFFFVITPLNQLLARMTKEPPVDTTKKKCPECMSEIAAEATRCAFCTAQLRAA
jgi:large conductance mechanosensitive channel